MTEQELMKMRTEMDDIDEKMVALFETRMRIAREIGAYKRAHNMAIHDPIREQAVVDAAVAQAEEPLKGEVALLMRSLLALAREYQRSSLFTREEELLPPPVPRKEQDVRCVFQGVSGAWSEQAALKLFPKATLSAVEFFEDVFTAVKRGAADYGVVPIENSQTGAIGETYDLLRKYGCYIVGRTWVDINHCLLVKEGAQLKDIRQVCSHPEGFKQCHRFLSDKSWDLIPCSNTAVAAKKVRDNDDMSLAAIGSRLAGQINGLEVLAPDIMDTAGNQTSFVVIGPMPIYDDESDLVSITFSIAHRSGALCEALLPFTSAGLNLTRIESRPSPGGKYRFFAEISGNIKDPVVLETLRHVAGLAEYLEVIGCYNLI
jgi:chorismate mutase/prephenate dehydratase